MKAFKVEILRFSFGNGDAWDGIQQCLLEKL
ncbi:hypothetical protein FHY18_004075 [Xanthomonas arboricola]|nr:hypothetical protein [Xanthomonas sp. 3793]